MKIKFMPEWRKRKIIVRLSGEYSDLLKKGTDYITESKDKNIFERIAFYASLHSALLTKKEQMRHIKSLPMISLEFNGRRFEYSKRTGFSNYKFMRLTINGMDRDELFDSDHLKQIINNINKPYAGW